MVKKAINKYFEAIGRRKSSTARVRLYPLQKGKEVSLNSIKIKTGEIFVNNKPITAVFNHSQEKIRYNAPLELTNNQQKFAISILVKGGGKTGQLEAIIHGLARAIEKVDKETHHSLLKKGGLLTRDFRKKERRKVGTGGKARRKKQSPKR